MKRAAGVLLSVTSLPSKYGIGCFDQSAYDFVDWLAKSGQRYWQVLPLSVTCYGASDDSPYQSYSAFAGNPYFISLDDLAKEGVITRAEIAALDFGSDPMKVDYDKLHENRYKILRKAYEHSDISKNEDYQRFVRENGWWLADYALFMALKNFFGDVAWTEWPEDIRMHWGFAMDHYRRQLYFDIEFQQYMQFKFYEQWGKLKAYANSRHVEIVGDIPIYVSQDSADVWAHPELFQLDEKNMPSQIAGCPPDGFSATGQVWGNPLYRWDYHHETNYDWWISRLWHCFRLYDVLRLDHFRGFDEYFAIPAGAQTAIDGHWEKGPGMKLFSRMKECLGDRRVIAEDLGYMTDTVHELVRDSGFPNMKVLEFAFDSRDTGAANDYLPHNYDSNCVVYTGTHDNETIVGWYSCIKPEERQMVRDYLCDQYTPDKELYHSMISLAMLCNADTCIIPIQDHLGLDNEHRMNQPSTVGKNWRWRVKKEQITDELSEHLFTLVKRYGRCNWAAINQIEQEALMKEEEAKKAAEEAAKEAAEEAAKAEEA